MPVYLAASIRSISLKLPLAAAILWQAAGTATLIAQTAETAATAATVPTVATADPLIVHEWGTFTTVSGSDGIQLEYRPLSDADSDLPSFVADRASVSGAFPFSKGRVRAKVRMETPVTYFYSKTVRTVQVSVEYPQGMLTEFYPPVREILPKFDSRLAVTEGEPIGNSKLDWGEVEIIPAELLRPSYANQADREWLFRRLQQTILPSETQCPHYNYARQTDSAYVHVGFDKQQGILTGGPFGNYLEKFLFYRGVGKTALPVQVSVNAQGLVDVSNQTADDIHGLVLVQVDGTNVRLATLDVAPAGQRVTFRATEASSVESCRESLRKTLLHHRLFEKEADAMLDTWANSWLGEVGTRVMLVMPRANTDAMLPLHIAPQPDVTERVLVARMEVFTPGDEEQLAGAALEFGKLHAEKLKVAVAAPADPAAESPPAVKFDAKDIPSLVQARGRLAEPALAKIAARTQRPELRDATLHLIDALRTLRP